MTKIKFINFWDEKTARNTLIANLGILHSYTNVDFFNVHYFQANFKFLIEEAKEYGIKLSGYVFILTERILSLIANELETVKKIRLNIEQMIIYL